MRKIVLIISVMIFIALGANACSLADNSEPTPTLLESTPTLQATPTTTLLLPIQARQSTLTATFNISDIPPGWSFTATPDPNYHSIGVIIEGNLSEEEIAKILFSKWLEHFMGENISLTDRLEGYAIEQIEIFLNPRCTINFGGVYPFAAKAHAILKTTLPLYSTSFATTTWASGGGNIVDEYTITKIFNGLIYTQDHINYTLLENEWGVPCE